MKVPIIGATPSPISALNATPVTPAPQPQYNFPNAQRTNYINALNLYFPVAVRGAIDELAIITAFGVNQARRAVVFKKTTPQFNVIQNYNPDAYDVIDPKKVFGDVLFPNKVYGTLTLGNTDPNSSTGNTYTGIDNNQYTFDNIVLPIALVEMSQKSIIGKTKITGRPGSIKQYITLDDWEIHISSVVTYPADQAPKDFMAALWKLKQAQVSIPVTNYFMNAFGITNIVIEDINPVQEEGGYSKLAFTISAISDIPITQFLP